MLLSPTLILPQGRRWNKTSVIMSLTKDNERKAYKNRIDLTKENERNYITI